MLLRTVRARAQKECKMGKFPQSQRYCTMSAEHTARAPTRVVRMAEAKVVDAEADLFEVEVLRVI